MANDTDIAQSDLRDLLLALDMGDHARPQSPHEVFQEALGVLRARLAPPCENDITQAMIQAGRYAANLNDGTLASIYLAMRGAERRQEMEDDRQLWEDTLRMLHHVAERDNGQAARLYVDEAQAILRRIEGQERDDIAHDEMTAAFAEVEPGMDGLPITMGSKP